MTSIRPATCLAGLACLALAGGAAAGRPDLRTMTCEEALDLVFHEGAVVMTTGEHTFQRFVASPAFCDPWQGTRPQVHQAKDTPHCPLPVCYEPMLPLEPFGS